jgi:hypothetical protein
LPSRESQLTSPIPRRSPAVPFEIGRWRHDADTVDGLPIEATEHPAISAQQMSHTQVDGRSQNGTVIFWQLTQDGQLSLWWENRAHFNRIVQPF